MTDSSQDASDREYDKISQINHALTLASTLYAQSHPELIGMLAEQSSPEMVLLETSILLNLKAFCSRNIFIEKSPSCKIFRDKSACDAHSYEAIEHLQGTVNSDVPMDERGDYHIEYGFLFYLTKGITTEADQHLFDSANHLLARALQVYPCLALDEQRQIMENLSHRAMKLKHSNDVVAAISCHKSAQMAYTMIERKESSDRLAMVYSFANIATLLQTQSFFHVTGAYLQAREFLKMLPVSEFELIKDKPIVKFVIQQITKAESQAVTKERPLMTK